MNWTLLPYIATYVSYVFIIVAYTLKITRLARQPLHLRWELYPLPHEPNYRYGGSYMEEPEWWTKPIRKNRLRALTLKIRDYFTLPGYFKRNRGYWLGLYPWHIGFYLIISFHVMSFLGALLLTGGVMISSDALNVWGRIVYYLTIFCAVGSFVLGSIGSIVLLIKRLNDRGLRTYAAASNYFNYVFFLVVFLSGLAAWAIADPTLASYREFWKGLFTFNYQPVEPLSFLHIMLFSLFLMYLPFTRSAHYLTKIMAFFGVLWDDRPNIEGKTFARELRASLDRPVEWSAPHIQANKKWGEVVARLPEETSK